MDLAPIAAKPDYVEKIRLGLPEMPWEKRERFTKTYGLSQEESAQLTEQREIADYFEACVAAKAPPSKASNWIRTEVQRMLNEKGIGIGDFCVSAEQLGRLIAKIEDKEISNTQAKDALTVMANRGAGLDEALKICGISCGRLTKEELEAAVRKVLAEEPAAAEAVRSGQDKKGSKSKFLLGLVMRETRGSADPAEVAELIGSLLNG